MQNARASSSRQHPSSARLAIHSFPFPSTLVGAALSLLLASPVLAAPSLPAPCNATGALENSMGGCATPPAPPASKTPSALSHETADFTAPEKFWIKTGKSGQEKTIRRNIVAWVAKRVVPHPSASESALLNAAILRLSASSFPMVREAAGPDLFAVTVDTKTLNRIAARLRRSVSSGRLAYRVNRTAVTGGTPGENRFVERSLPIPPSGVVDAQEVSNSLYQVSQVPGFVRADALFSPAVGVKRAGTGAGRREGRFDRPVTFTIKSDQTSLREIRRLIALYVGKCVSA